MNSSPMRASCFASTAVVALALLIVTPLHAASDSSSREARVTQVIRDVKILQAGSKPEAATVNEKIGEDSSVRTGDESRSELTFVDLTITRLGANTLFSFNQAGRSARLNGGSMLVRVPKDSGGARLKTDACSVAVTGTTLVLQATRAGRNKLYLLEGGGRMWLNKYPKESRTIGPGQMLDVPAGATSMPLPQNFDVNRFMKDDPLITDFPPLPSRDLIYAAARNNPAGPVYQGGVVNPPGGNPGPIGIGTPFFPIFPGGGGNYSPGGSGNNPPNYGGANKGGKKKKSPLQPSPTPYQDSNSGAANGQPSNKQLPNSKLGNVAGYGNAQTSPSPTPVKKKKKKQHN